MPMNFYMPTRVITGSGSLEKNAALISAFGRRCLIVTGHSSAKKCGALDALDAALKKAGVEYQVYSAVAQNPTVLSCIEAGKQAREFGADFIVGAGGGSALDAAKAASVFTADPTMDEAAFYSGQWRFPPVPVVLVGTTSGTGSEVTSVAVLTDSDGRKHSIHDKRLYAKIAFGDPAFTMSLPAPQTVSTCVDAVTHCVESYFSKKADDISRAFSLRGISIIMGVVDASHGFESELDINQRESLYNASILGGLAINGTGTVFPHNVGYYFTETYHLPHGIASALLMPELLEHARHTAPEYFDGFISGLGCSYQQFVDFFNGIMPKVDIEMTQGQLESILPRWENNNSVNNTIGKVDTALLSQMLYRRFISGAQRD